MLDDRMVGVEIAARSGRPKLKAELVWRAIAERLGLRSRERRGLLHGFAQDHTVQEASRFVASISLVLKPSITNCQAQFGSKAW